MRKAILFMMISAKGYFEAPNHNIDWHTADEAFNDFAVAQTASAGALLFGRVTYEMMAAYWPTQQAMDNDPAITQVMNRLPKVVFSRTLDRAGWDNTRLVKTDAAAEVTRLKQAPGDDIFILGSSDLAASLAAAGLIDEYRLMLSPVLLAQGTPLLQGLAADIKLKLLHTRTFANGNLLLTYQPA
jgi:dihydrofolate reductase